MAARSLRPVQWKISLDAETAARIETILMDPLRGKPIYGGRSELIESLLEAWLQSNEVTKTFNTIDDLIPPSPLT